MNRRKKYLLLSGTTTLLIVVALVLVNLLTIYITDRYPVSIDLTPQKVFGLTEQSKEYLSKLEQPVSIQVMTNEDTFIASGDYYVQADGAMATSQWIGGYYVDTFGKWVRNA